MFFERQRDTPHPIPLDFFPRSWDNFNICDNITAAREKVKPKTALLDLWQLYSNGEQVKHPV